MIHVIPYRSDDQRLEQVWDTLLIGDVTDTKITFYVKTYGNYHHMCYATGDAQKNGDHYLFTHQECHLQIKFDAHRATLLDGADNCQKYYCGMMGYLQGDFERYEK